MNLKYYSVTFGILAWLVVVFAAPASTTAADPSYRVYADSVSAGLGEDVAVRFSLFNQYAISSLTIPLSYDTDILTLKSISFTGSRVEYLANKIITPADVDAIDGHFMVSAFTMFEDPVPAGDGLAFTAVFTVSPTATLETTTLLDTLFYPPGGSLIVIRYGQSGVIEPMFTAGKVTIGAANRSPVFASLADQYVLEGDSLALLIHATDPDHDDLTMAITSKPSGASFTDNGDGTARLVWVPDYVGPNSSDGSPKAISFWASDGDLSSKMDLKVYVIDRNRAPQISGPTDVLVEAGDPLQFTVSAIDPDFESLSWNLSGQPTTAQFDGNNPGHFIYQPDLTASGQSVVRFVAMDPQGLEDTLDVNLTVRAVELYTIGVDSVDGLPGSTVSFSVRLENKLPVSSFNVLFNIDPSVLSLLSLEATGTRAESFEYFNVTQNDKTVPGNVRIVGVVDVDGGGTLEVGEGAIASGQIRITGDVGYAGYSIPLYFMYQDAPVNDDNTLTDADGVKITQSEIYFVSGNVQIQEIGDILIGDINLNRIAADIGDVIYFTNFFINPSLYAFDILQYANSDVNRDGIPATVSDLVALINWVVTGVQPGKSAAGLTDDEAVLWQQSENGRLTVGYESDIEMGGVLLTVRTDGELGPELLQNLAGDMKMVYCQDGEQVYILMYSLTGTTMPAGRTELVAIDGYNDLSVTAAEMGSFDGRLIQVAFASSAGSLPTEFTLSQNYPNPFNPETAIEFSLPVASDVELTIYNVLGQQVRVLVDATYPAGVQRVTWNGRDDRGQRVSSGIYFYRLTYGSKSQTRKMMLLK